MKWIKKFLDGFKYRYVGRVMLETYVTKGGKRTGEYYLGYMHLMETNRGRRKMYFTGEELSKQSPFSINALSQIEGWKRGGPLPDNLERNEVPKKGNLTLTVIDGGK